MTFLTGILELNNNFCKAPVLPKNQNVIFLSGAEESVSISIGLGDPGSGGGKWQSENYTNSWSRFSEFLLEYIGIAWKDQGWIRNETGTDHEWTWAGSGLELDNFTLSDYVFLVGFSL